MSDDHVLSDDPALLPTVGENRPSWFSISAYFFLLLIWPVLAFWRAPLSALDFAWLIETSRMYTYISSAAFLWVAFFVVWGLQRVDRRRLSELGFTTPESRDFFTGILFLLVAYPLLGAMAYGLEAIGLAIPEVVIQALLPETLLEKTAWIGLCITAAVCEETVFRGYLLAQGERILKSRWLAVALSCLAFGTGHYYQGWGGAILITIYGLFFALLRLKTGTLWACILAHALQDIAAMFLAPLQNR